MHCKVYDDSALLAVQSKCKVMWGCAVLFGLVVWACDVVLCFAAECGHVVLCSANVKSCGPVLFCVVMWCGLVLCSGVWSCGPMLCSVVMWSCAVLCSGSISAAGGRHPHKSSPGPSPPFPCLALHPP